MHIYIYISIHSHTKALSQLVILITWARDRLLMLGSQYGFPRLDGRGASLLFTMAVSFVTGCRHAHDTTAALALAKNKLQLLCGFPPMKKTRIGCHDLDSTHTYTHRHAHNRCISPPPPPPPAHPQEIYFIGPAPTGSPLPVESQDQQICRGAGMVYMCVCVYIYIHTCVCIYIYIICIYIYIDIIFIYLLTLSICTRTSIYNTHTRILTCHYTCMHACIHPDIHIHAHRHTLMPLCHTYLPTFSNALNHKPPYAKGDRRISLGLPRMGGRPYGKAPSRSNFQLAFNCFGGCSGFTGKALGHLCFIVREVGGYDFRL